MLSDERQQELVKAMRTISDNLNSGFGSNENEIVEAMFNELAKDHRTLQQGFWRVIKKLAHKYKDVTSDARNEGAVMLAKKIDELDVCLPFI